MTTTETDLLKLTKERSEFSNPSLPVFKTKTALSAVEGYGIWVFVGFGPLLAVVYSFLFIKNFDASVISIIISAVLGLYPGYIVMIIIYSMALPMIKSVIFSYYKVSKKEFDTFNDKIREVDQKIQQLKYEDHNEKQRQKDIELSTRLNDLFRAFVQKTISADEASTLLQKLKTEGLLLAVQSQYKFPKSEFNKEVQRFEKALISYVLSSQKSASLSTNSENSNKPLSSSSDITFIEQPGKTDLHTKGEFNQNLEKIEVGHGSKTFQRVPEEENGKTEQTKPKTIQSTKSKPITTTIVNGPVIGSEKPLPDLPFVNPKVEDELPLNEVFDKSTKKKAQREHQFDTPVKRDYEALNAKRSMIGLIGERFAIEWEKKKMAEQGLTTYINKVKHVSQTDDALGYDILSYSWQGLEKYIEVKTTTENQYAPFYLSENELRAMKRLSNYFIYRVYDLNTETGEGRIYTINCKENFERFYDIKPTGYYVTPK